MWVLWLIVSVAALGVLAAVWFTRVPRQQRKPGRHSRLSRVVALGRLEDAMGRAEDKSSDDEGMGCG